MIAELNTERLAYAEYVSFAGKPLLVRSNSLVILSHTASFFSPYDGEGVPEHPAAELRLMRREDGCDSTEGSQWFRGRGYFALARFTQADYVWFNLRTRSVCGLFSDAIVSDEFRWHKDILPTIAGILAAFIAVVPVHAACLAKNGSGVLLAGQSGVGKSTLAVTLARRGYSFLADDWTYLAQKQTDVAAWSVPVPVKLLPDASGYFPELASYSCAHSLNGELAYEVSPQKCFGLPRKENCAIKCIVLLERSRQPGISISPVTAGEAIGRLSSEIELLLGPLVPAYHAQMKLLQGLSDAVCLRASFDASPQEVAFGIDEVLADILPSIRTARRTKIGLSASTTCEDARQSAGYPVTMRQQDLQAVLSDVAVATETGIPQNLGMMHRHKVLDLKATCQWFGMTVRIDTNSPVTLQAAQNSGFIPVDIAETGVDLRLEFAIEDAHDGAPGSQLRVLRNEQTVFIETGQRGWFAFDAEAGIGGGYLTSGGAGETIEKCFKTVADVIRPLVRRSIKGTARRD